jgi:hypothetical protein
MRDWADGELDVGETGIGIGEMANGEGLEADTGLDRRQIGSGGDRYRDRGSGGWEVGETGLPHPGGGECDNERRAKFLLTREDKNASRLRWRCWPAMAVKFTKTLEMNRLLFKKEMTKYKDKQLQIA